MKRAIVFFIMLVGIMNSIYIFAKQKEQITFEDGTVAYLFTNDGYWGVESDKGKVIIPDMYEKIERYGNLFYCTYKRGAQRNYCELYYRDGTIKIKESDQYSSLKFFYNNEHKWNAIDASLFTNKHCVFNDKGDILYKYRGENDSKGFRYSINELSDTIVVEPGKYTQISITSEFLSVKYGSKVGYLNYDGSVIIPPIYSHIETYGSRYYTEGFIVTRSKSGKGVAGYYDRKGKCIIPPTIYTSIRQQQDGNFVVKNNGQAYVIDSMCNILLTTKYRDIQLVKNEQDEWCYVTFLGNGKGIMSYDGQIIEEPHPRRVETPYIKQYGFSYIQVYDSSGLWGINDTLGNTIIPCNYDFIMYYVGGKSYQKEGFLVQNSNEFLGYCDVTGKNNIPCKYHDIKLGEYNPDIFIVELSGLYGICNKKGKEIIKPFYDDIFVDENNQIYAQLGIMKGVLDFKGNVIIPFEYTDIKYEKQTGNYNVNLFGYKGICSHDGKIIIPPRYTNIYKITYKNSNFYKVIDGKLQGLYSEDGKMLFPASVFEYIELRETDISAKSLGIKDNLYIRAKNNNEPYCYYDIKGNLIYDARQKNNFDKLCNLASEEFDKKNYPSAINYYMQAINIRKCEFAYYNIGVSYYNQGNYNDAIQYFKKGQEISVSQELYNKAGDLIIRSKQHIQAKRREAGQIFLLGLVGSALTIGNVILQSNTAQYNYNNNMHLNSHNMNYLLDPQYAMYQTQQEIYQEYLQTTGGSISFDEFMQIRAQAIYEMQEGSQVQNTSAFDNSSSSYKGKLSPEQYREQYTRYENIVKGWFSNLSHNGSYTDKNGNKRGFTESDMPTAAYLGNKMGLLNAQKEMRRIRMEADAAGVHIEESKWETATSF